MELNTAIYSWIIYWFTYWIVGGFLSYIAHVNKIREISDLKDIIKVLLINMMWTFLGMVLMCFVPLRAMIETHIVVKLFLTYLVTDIWFYHVHIMLHQGQIYPYLHKLHHHFQFPTSLAALYCTGYEAIFLNVVSVSLGPVIFELPPLYLHIWFFIVALNSVLSHSGITIPFLTDNYHDLHHSHYNCNYSISPFLDKLYGTYKDPEKVIKDIKGNKEDIKEVIGDTEVIGDIKEVKEVTEVIKEDIKEDIIKGNIRGY